MSNSPLAVYTCISPNSNNPRSHRIDTITIHHMAGNLSVEACGDIFKKPERQASSNYGIGSDGRIGLYVEEKNRSWCTSSRENDHRAITIEVANDGGAPDWHVSDKALEATIALCTDICQRNGIEKLNYTGDKSGNLTMHKWFAATACPGPYLGGKFPYIAEEVNRRLGIAKEPQIQQNLFRVQVGAFSKKANAQRKLEAVKSAGFSDAFIASVDGKLWRVQVGAFQERANAERRLEDLREEGFTGFVTILSGEVESPDPVPETTKSVEDLAREAIQGKWGNGAERKQRLTDAGYDYTAVQNRVNALMK